MLLLAAATVVTVSAPWLTIIAGLAIPALTAAATRDLTGWLQVVLLAVLSAVAGVVAQSTTGMFPLWPTVWTVALTALVAVGAHYGYAVSGLLGAINRRVPGVIGPTGGPTALPAPRAAEGTHWFASRP